MSLLVVMRAFSRRQWRAAVLAGGIAFLLMGIVGETLPGASLGRAVPVEWWNYVTLVLSPLLIGLIAATFVTERPSGARSDMAKAGAGAGGLIGTLAMACPACSPIAIPFFGAGGLLSFLAPERGAIALLSVALLALTLHLRLRAARACELAPSQPV